ncbi:MAG: Phosphate-specific transport system accessory protein PhoU [Verrucomicrobiota bacterium]|jgi:phosphate transport system protein
MSLERREAYWEHRLQEVRAQLSEMGRLAQRNLHDSLQALIQGDSDLADQVESRDSEVDALEKHLDATVVAFVSTHSPAATDCRQLLMAMKIGAEWEEIADQATTIARRARQLSRCATMGRPIPLESIANPVQAMVAASLQALDQKDSALARSVIDRDDEVDRAYAKAIHEIQASILADRSVVGPALHWLTILKALERAADRSANIAEEIVFWLEAEDIRHTTP